MTGNDKKPISKFTKKFIKEAHNRFRLMKFQFETDMEDAEVIIICQEEASQKNKVKVYVYPGSSKNVTKIGNGRIERATMSCPANIDVFYGTSGNHCHFDAFHLEAIRMANMIFGIDVSSKSDDEMIIEQVLDSVERYLVNGDTDAETIPLGI